MERKTFFFYIMFIKTLCAYENIFKIKLFLKVHWWAFWEADTTILKISSNSSKRLETRIYCLALDFFFLSTTWVESFFSIKILSG